MKKILKAVVFIIIIAIIGVVGYSFLNKDNGQKAVNPLESSSGVMAVGDVDVEATSVSNQFLELLLNMQNIKLDQSIFQDESFRSLEDFSVDIVPRGNEGRINPFAPVGVETVPEEVNLTTP